MSVTNICTFSKLLGCSVVLTGSFGDNCPSKCIYLTRFMLKKKMGRRIHLYSVTSPHSATSVFSLQIPLLALDQIFMTLYPVLDQECNCTITFHNFLYPNPLYLKGDVNKESDVILRESEIY